MYVSIHVGELSINRQSVFQHVCERLEQIRLQTFSYNLTCIKGLLFHFENVCRVIEPSSTMGVCKGGKNNVKLFS